MPAASLDLNIEQGATFTRRVTLSDRTGARLDLTGWILRGQIRENQNSPAATADFVCTLLNQATNKGQAEFSLSNTTTAAIEAQEVVGAVFKNKVYLYEVEIEKPTGEVLKLLRGNANLIPGIVR